MIDDNINNIDNDQLTDASEAEIEQVEDTQEAVALEHHESDVQAADDVAAEVVEQTEVEPSAEVSVDPGEEAPAHLLESAEPDMTTEEIAAIVEAILFATETPLTLAKIAKVAELPQKYVRDSIETLNTCYEEIGASFRIENIAGGFQMMTKPEYNDILRRLFKAKKDSRLGNAAMETLAIIAYRQPVIRADIESIRGVSCGEVLRGLMQRNLVKIIGRADVIGRPMLYGTTRKFLEIFGLSSLKDLPRVDELKNPLKIETPDDQPEPEAQEEADEQAIEAVQENAGIPADEQKINADISTDGLDANEDELVGVYVEDCEEDQHAPIEVPENSDQSVDLEEKNELADESNYESDSEEND